MAELEGVFEACVAQLNSGTPLDACLALHPAEAVELKPLLQIVASLQTMGAAQPVVDQIAAQDARSRFLARAAALSQPATVSREEALDSSSAMIAAGATAGDCLNAFPHYAAGLRPLLGTLAAMQQVSQPAPRPSPEARAAGRALFLSQAAALSQSVPVAIEDALETSLQMVEHGATVEECLKAFPSHAFELRSALAIAAALQSHVAAPAPVRPAKTLGAQRKAFLAAARLAGRSASARLGQVTWLEALAGLFRQPAWARAAALLLVLVLTLGFGRVAGTLASVALPGDTLYPVKIVAEQARLVATLDENERSKLREQFEQSRRDEAAVVVEQGRQVQVQFSGVIASMVDGVWWVDGLEMPVLVPGDAVVRGQPAAGAPVIILAYSDGAGSLVARQVLVLTPVTAVSATPTATYTPTRSPTPTLAQRAAPPAFTPSSPLRPPTRTPTRTPAPTMTWTATLTATLTLTPTPSVTPSGTPSGTPTATPSVTPMPRPVTFFGAIQEMQPTWWRVGARGVLITPQTSIDESQGPAVIGANVEVNGLELPDGSVAALAISVQGSSVETGYITDVIYQMGGSRWLIGDRWVVVTGSTEIVGAPAVGKVARVSMERRAGGDWTATRIEVEEQPEPYEFEGLISAIGANSWVVDGRVVMVNSSTSITGLSPRVGLYGEVRAIESGGGLLALSINVVAATPPPPPTSTPTSPLPTATPTASPTLEPTLTPTPTLEPTLTPTPPTEPTLTPTPTLEPTLTPTPPTEPTETVEPPLTATPEPPSATPTSTTGPPIPPPIDTPTPAPPTATPAPSPTLVIPFPTPTFSFPTL